MRARALLMCLLFAVGVLGSAASAQTDDVDDDVGSIAGQAYDGQTGKPVAGATVTLSGVPEGGEVSERSVVTGADGNFSFDTVPAGSYRLQLSAPGYAELSTDALVKAGEASRADTALEAIAAEAPAAPPSTPGEAPPAGEEAAAEPAEEAIDFEEFLVVGSTIDMEPLQLRIDSDELLNILGAEEFAKFAAGDVAEGIKRVAGVNVVEGQFAIIRGLEDRYSSTTYNGAPVPSPDPNRQSVQLDLFPSEIVNNLVVAKTFAPDLPSNSAGGSIDVVTGQYPEEPEIKLKGKAGYNENAIDRFLELEGGNPVGIEIDGITDTWDREAGAFMGGRSELAGRELRVKLLGNWEINYDTAEGFQEDREPTTFNVFPPDGGLARGELGLTSGRFDLTTSEWEEQQTGFGAAGFDFDEAGNHGIDVSLFWTRKQQEAVQLEDNGYLSGFDYNKPGGPVELETTGNDVIPEDFEGHSSSGRGNATISSWIANIRGGPDLEEPNIAPLWFSSFSESKSFETERDLLVPQINGDHVIDAVPGLHFSWAANYAKTTQSESARGARMWYEPCGYAGDYRLTCPDGVAPIAIPTVFPVTVAALGPGQFIGDESVFANWNDIDEDQWFGRLDGDYEMDLSDWLTMSLRASGWLERASRDVDSNFIDQLNIQPDVNCQNDNVICGGDTTRPMVFADSREQLGQRLFANAFLLDDPDQPIRETESEARREVEAIGLGAKTTFWEDLDLLGGVRIESLYIESENDPFVDGEFDTDATPLIYPSKFLMFDPLGDNTAREPAIGPPYNFQVLGLSLPSGSCRVQNLPGQIPTMIVPGSEGRTCIDLVSRAEIEQFINGTIDESHVLPTVGIAWRPIDGLALRGAWSQTVARPSFRELGYYPSVEPASDDVIVGNPQLQLSDVESWDTRAEYVWGDRGELAAVSFFYKTIEDPIESIILRDPTNFLDDLDSALYRTFFNNPNEATLWGIELEARKNLGFVGQLARPSLFDFLDFLEHFTIGGNFTWIDAEVDRTQAELARSIPFFTRNSGLTLDTSRRLFGQPEWIANADVTFEHPDWGTKVTLAYYAISDVLDAAGAVTSNQNGEIIALTLDRYVDSFHTIDLVLSQELWGGFALKLNAKNLTDSERGIIYDAEATTAEYEERAFKLGREYSLELSYTFSEEEWPFSWPGGDE